MIGAPDNAGVARLRAAKPSETTAIQAILEASSVHDDPAGWSGGAWSVAAWATDLRVLDLAGCVVGLVAVRAQPGLDGTVSMRVALEVSSRQLPLATLLVQGGLDLVRESGAQRARMFVPARATWIQTAATTAGFLRVRTIARMLLPASVPSPTPVPASESSFRLRSILPGEDEQVLSALNRAWTGTWNFAPISLEMLQRDLQGQREGMLLGVELDAPSHIIGTCHAVFEPTQQNPDGNPRAWISNVTVDPNVRGRGIARAMLTAGIKHLRSRGAGSITLGVDADNPAPFRLYQSVGFEVSSAHEAWDRDLT
ncbi:MAG: GNAT family N-acetyltransferase [Chloroflexota bacterium]